MPAGSEPQWLAHERSRPGSATLSGNGAAINCPGQLLPRSAARTLRLIGVNIVDIWRLHLWHVQRRVSSPENCKRNGSVAFTADSRFPIVNAPAWPTGSKTMRLDRRLRRMGWPASRDLRAWQRWGSPIFSSPPGDRLAPTTGPLASAAKRGEIMLDLAGTQIAILCEARQRLGLYPARLASLRKARLSVAACAGGALLGRPTRTPRRRATVSGSGASGRDLKAPQPFSWPSFTECNQYGLGCQRFASCIPPADRSTGRRNGPHYRSRLHKFASFRPMRSCCRSLRIE